MSTPVTFAHGTVGAGVTSLVAPVTVATSVNDVALIGISVGGTSSPTISSISDGTSNRYVLVKSFTTSAPYLYVYAVTYTTALTLSDNITVTFSASTIHDASLSGTDLGKVLFLDVAVLANGTSTAPSVSGTPVYPGDEAIGIFAWSNTAGTGTIGTGYTQLDQQHPASGAYLTTAYDLTTTAGAAQTAGYTVTSAAWRGVIVLVATQPYYFTNSSFITNLNTSNGTVTAAAFNVAGALSITADTGTGSGGAPSAPGSLPAGYTTTPILKYTAYAQLVTDIAAANIPSGYTWLAYDNEYEDDGAGGNNWPTPMTEANDPWTYMASFVTLAQAHGYKVMLMPARDLAHNNNLVQPQNTGETDDAWYVRTNIAGTAAATGAEVVHIQDQANQGTTEYLTFWNSVFAQAVKASGRNPLLQVTVGVSTTNPTGVTAAQMTSSAQSVSPPAGGFWLNMSSATAAMGITFLQNMQAGGSFSGGGLTTKHGVFSGTGTVAGGAVSATGAMLKKKPAINGAGTVTIPVVSQPSVVLPRPDYLLEANFWNTADAPVWTNISDYVELQEGVKLGKRRQTVFDEVAPATFAGSLDNSDGAFNNDKSSSPFAGKVLLNVPIRFRMRWPNVPATTPNMLNDFQSNGTNADYFTVDQGTIQTDDTIAPVTLDDNNADAYVGSGWTTRTDSGDFGGTCQECSTTTSYAQFTFTGTKITWVGEKNSDHGIAAVSIDGGSSTLVDLYASSRSYQNNLYVASNLSPGQHVITITVNGTKNASSSGFVISVDAFVVESVSTPPSGQTDDIVWNTGVVDRTSVGVFTGNNPTRVPDDHPIYVTPGLPYAAQVKVKDNTAGTGISFKVSGRLRWFDQTGGLISETTGTITTLTTSYQNVGVSGIAPLGASTVRLGICNETTVGPSTRKIYFDGYDIQSKSNDLSNSLTVPSTADVGDYAQAWVRINSKTAVVTAPAGWSQTGTWVDQGGHTLRYSKIVTPADVNTTFTWTSTVKMRWLNFLVCYGGVDQTTPIHTSSETTESVFRTTHTTPSVTTTVSGCWIESCVFDVSSTTTLWTNPVGENVRDVGYNTGGSAPTGIITDDGTPHGTGTYGTKAFTSNVSSKYATMHTTALNPATTTGPNNVSVQMGEWQLVQASSVSAWQAGGHWESKFTGLADSWNERFTGDLVLMDLAATDRQKILNTITIDSATYESIQQNDPIAYYKLDEGSPQINTYQEAANSADTSQPTLKRVAWGTGGALNWGQGTGPPVDGAAALMTAPVNQTNGVGLRTLLSNPIAGANAVTLLCWWNSTATGTGQNFTIMKLQDATNGLHPKASMELRYSPGANLNAFGWISSDTYDITVQAAGTGSYGDGKTHLVAATFQLVGGNFQLDLYIDGVDVVTQFTGTAVSQFQPLVMLAVANAGSSANLHAATFSHAAVYPVALDPSSIADIYNAGTKAFAGDTVDQRIGRLMQWEGQQGVDLDQSATIVDRHMPDSQSLLDAIRQASRSEGGTTYVDGEGNVAFRSRLDKEDTGDPLITVPAQQVDPSLQKVIDDALLVNKPVINRLATGVSTTVVDSDSIARNGVYEKDVDTILENDQDAINYATYLMSFFSDPKARCDTLTLEGLLLQDWADVLLIDMWQLVRITSLPTTEQDDTLDLFIEGWEFDIDPDSFKITFDTSVAIPFAILGDTERGVCGQAVVGW